MYLYQMAYVGIQIYSFLKIFMTILSDPFFLGAMLILKRTIRAQHVLTFRLCYF